MEKKLSSPTERKKISERRDTQGEEKRSKGKKKLVGEKLNIDDEQKTANSVVLKTSCIIFFLYVSRFFRLLTRKSFSFRLSKYSAID